MKYLVILYSFFGICFSNQVNKFCRNCKHFIPLRFKNDFIISQNFGKCDKFITIINKELDYECVEKVRNTDTMCGSEGKYFNSSIKIDYHKLTDQYH
jgi:predicted nucleic acid-binding Zn finger protein